MCFRIVLLSKEHCTNIHVWVNYVYNQRTSVCGPHLWHAGDLDRGGERGRGLEGARMREINLSSIQDYALYLLWFEGFYIRYG